MGFLGLIRSIEELLYEVMTWLVFYPRTLLKVLRHPQQMSDYSDREQDDAAADQYTDTLSPPIFLILSILICHGIELALGLPIDRGGGALGKLFSNSEETLLFLRLLTFSIYPMIYAVDLVNRSAVDLDRKTLREPFFSQCYLGAIFAIAASVSSILMRFKEQWVVAGGLGLLMAGIVVYLVTQAIWLRRHLAISRWRAALISIAAFVKGTVVVVLISSVFAA